MKIKDEHYNFMRAKLAPFKGQIESFRQRIINEGKASDVEKRLRWDLCYLADLTWWLCENVYTYAHDEHIDTALRAIMKELEQHSELDAA